MPASEDLERYSHVTPSVSARLSGDGLDLMCNSFHSLERI